MAACSRMARAGCHACIGFAGNGVFEVQPEALVPSASHVLCHLHQLVQADLLLLAPEVVLGRQEQHAVALLQGGGRGSAAQQRLSKEMGSGCGSCKPGECQDWPLWRRQIRQNRMLLGRSQQQLQGRDALCELRRKQEAAPVLAPYLALAHGHAGAVPEALLRLGCLVVIMAAGAERCAELVLVLRKALDYHRRHREVHAEVCARPASRKPVCVDVWGAKGTESPRATMLQLRARKELGRGGPHLWAYCSENLRMTSKLRSSGATSVAAGGQTQQAKCTQGGGGAAVGGGLPQRKACAVP